MSDLISRSFYKSKLMKALDVLNKEYREAMLNEDNDLILAIKNQQSAYMIALRLLDNEQTVYSVDKVVEELKERADFLKDCTKYGNKNAKQQAESYNTMRMYEVADLVDDLIEIVKHGGVGTETETIRDKAVKWNNNSSKRVPYEFIDYVEGKREICVSDDVCEWEYISGGFIKNPHTKRLYSAEPSMKNVYFNTCGKKIKIVGD